MVKSFKLPSGISREDVKRALDADFWNNKKVVVQLHKHDRVMAATIALYTGRRRGEIALLRREDIDWERRYITRTILKKRPRRRVDIPYGREFEYYLKRRWIIKGRPYRGRVVEGNPRGRSVSFHRWAKRRGRELRFHDLRHLYALNMLGRGVPLPVLRKLLQHSDLRVTSIYLELDTRDLEDFVL